MSQLRRDTRTTLFSRLPVMLLSFLSIVLLTRLLGPQGMGVYTYVFAVLNLVLMFGGFQLDGTMTFFLARHPHDQHKIFSTIGFLSLVAMGIAVVVLFIIVFFVPAGNRLFIPPGQSVVFFFVFLIVAFVCRHITTLVLSALRGIFRFKLFNAYMIGIQLLPVLIYTFILLSVTKDETPDLTWIFRIILLSEGTLTLLGIALLFFKTKIRFGKDFKSLQKPVLQYSSKNLLSVSGHFLNKRLDVWFVQHIRGTTALGYYGLATQVTNFVNEAFIPFNQVMLPYLASPSGEDHAKIVGRIARINLFIALVAATGIALTSWLFIPLFFGKAFVESIPAVQILCIGILFLSQRLVFSNYFKATDQMRFPIQGSWGAVLITILLDILLIPGYGIMGAAIASVIAYAMHAMYLIYHALRKLNLQVADIVFIRNSDLKWLFSLSTKKKETNSFPE